MLSPVHRAALLCNPGCACGKHANRNSGQFQLGGIGFSGRHSGETREHLASFTGELASSYKHGWAGTGTYRTWSSMRSRCWHRGNASYDRYGGRGITVCERWLIFENFLADMGERPAGMTLDRIDGDGNYEPSNCRWATKQEQESHKSNPWLEPEKRARILAGRNRSTS